MLISRKIMFLQNFHFLNLHLLKNAIEDIKNIEKNRFYLYK